MYRWCPCTVERTVKSICDSRSASYRNHFSKALRMMEMHVHVHVQSLHQPPTLFFFPLQIMWQREAPCGTHLSFYHRWNKIKIFWNLVWWWKLSSGLLWEKKRKDFIIFLIGLVPLEMPCTLTCYIRLRSTFVAMSSEYCWTKERISFFIFFFFMKEQQRRLICLFWKRFSRLLFSFHCPFTSTLTVRVFLLLTSQHGCCQVSGTAHGVCRCMVSVHVTLESQSCQVFSAVYALRVQTVSARPQFINCQAQRWVTGNVCPPCESCCRV